MSQHKASKLNKLAPELQSWGKHDVDIIWIPEYGSRTPATVALQSLRSLSPCRFQLLEYEYEFKGLQVWPTLVQRGDDLLQILVHDERYTGNNCRRIIFICHGLGGIIAKRALAVMTDTYYNPACQRILSLHSGTVFLGTPHPTYGQRSQWPILSLILQTSSSKYSKALLARAEVEAAIVVNISLKFEQAGIEGKIISVFETKHTKFSERIFRSRREILVDRSFSETRSKNEKIIFSDSDHHGIAKIAEGSTVAQEIFSMINSPILEPNPSDLYNLSISSSGDAGDDIWASTTAGTEEATKDPDQPEKSETPNTGSGVSPADATQDSAETQATEKITTLPEFATATFRAPSLPCFLLRPHSENPDFFGRKETLDSIEDVLQPPELRCPHMGSQSLRSITLCGFGGVGKTQIALQYAFNSIRNNTYDAVFWVQADGKEKIANSFKEVALQLKLIEATEATDPVVTRNIVLEWLSRPYRGSLSDIDIDIDSPAQEQSFAKWLMIFDNADSPELLRDLWPVSGHGSALVTSRDPHVGTYLHSTKNIVLQPFNTDEASRLLCELAFISDATPEEQAASIELSEKVGGYPLALVLISSSMRRNRVTFMEALESYDKEAPRSELYNAQVASPYDRYSKTLSSVWVFKESGDYANLLLEILSLLDPDAISETILRGKGRPVQSTEIALRQLQHEYLEARKEVVKSSLVRQDSKGKQLIIHRVVQEHIRKRMSPERQSMVYTYAVRLLLEAWIHDSEEKFTHLKALWDTAKIVLPHAYRLMKLYQSEYWELKLPADVECDLARLLQKSGWYLFEIGYCESSFPLLECALKLCEKHATNLEVKTLLADILFSLSSFSAEKNQPQDALQYASRHLDIRMQVENEKPHLGRHAGLAYTEMALGLLLNGEYEAAIRYSRDGKAILIELEAFKEGKYWPDFAVIHEAISLIALGRGSEAIPMLKDSIAFRENKYGPNDTESFKFGFHTQLLANVYSQQGNWKEAAELYQRSLSNYRATVGDHYHRTSQVCVKLAEYHAREFQVETANIYFDQAIKNFRLYTFTKPELIRTIYLKAFFYRRLGSLEAAESLIQEANTIYRELFNKKDLAAIFELSREELDSVVPVWSR